VRGELLEVHVQIGLQLCLGCIFHDPYRVVLHRQSIWRYVVERLQIGWSDHAVAIGQRHQRILHLGTLFGI